MMLAINSIVRSSELVRVKDENETCLCERKDLTMLRQFEAFILLIISVLYRAESFQFSNSIIRHSSSKLSNTYDDWRSDRTVDTLCLDEDSVEMCLAEFINSNFGKEIFGVHDLPGAALTSNSSLTILRSQKNSQHP